MTKPLRFLFFAVVVRAVVLIALGLTVRHRQRLPAKGPAVLAANHNSHLDTLVLMSLLPLRLLDHVRPVAAADYFLKPGLLGWFARHIIGIIPIERGGGRSAGNPLAPCEQALDRGDILIIFPEGSLGEPEALTQFKKGIGHLARARTKVPVVPVFMHGLGKALPKGSALLVPFNCTVSVGEPLYGKMSYGAFVTELEAAMTALAKAERVPAWE
jgi:1-acyl-sn-glycerol-3-phosphate acyltransferase